MARSLWNIRPSPSPGTFLSWKRIESRSNRLAIPTLRRRHSARLNSPYSMWDLMSGGSTGGHPRTSTGEDFITPLAWFNCRCLSFRQKEKPLEQKEPLRDSKHVPGFIWCRGENPVKHFQHSQLVAENSWQRALSATSKISSIPSSPLRQNGQREK